MCKERSPRLLLLFWLTIAANFGVAIERSKAVRFNDEKFAFESAVLLLDAHATFNGVRVRQAKYYFDLALPRDIGEPLGKVVIQQRTGGDRIEFKPDKTKAYLGNHHQKQQELNLDTTYDEETGLITVKFKQPIPPGNNLTIRLKPKSNPDYAGVYLFGVTAFPPGKESIGLYLGPGRLHFYQNDPFYF